MIAQELDWAESLGFNILRIYLHNLAWQADSEGLKSRMDVFLNLAHRRSMRAMFVLFDDCWNDNPKIGPQPVPIPGVHNSGWMRSPGSAVALDPSKWNPLERYVEDIVKEFGRDERVAIWDLYNEPAKDELSLPLLREVFGWARAAAPMQPLTSGVWCENKTLNEYQIAASDIISFHNYGDAAHLERMIADLKRHGRPLLCSEYMARTQNSLFQTHLPIFKANHVGCINWGLVSGKTQTIYPWNSPQGGPEPSLWFHDIFRADGTPFDPQETDCIRSMTGKA